MTTLEIAPPDLQKAQQIMNAVMAGMQASKGDAGMSDSVGSGASRGKGKGKGGAAFATPTLSTAFTARYPSQR